MKGLTICSWHVSVSHTLTDESKKPPLEVIALISRETRHKVRQEQTVIGCHVTVTFHKL